MFRLRKTGRAPGEFPRWLAYGIAGAIAAPLVVVILRDDEPTPVEADRPAIERLDNPAAAVRVLSAGARSLGLPRIDLGLPERPSRQPRFPIVRVREGKRITLRVSPGGKPIALLGARTEFGSPRSLRVAEVRGDWFGVPAPQLPNGTLGWIHDDRTKLAIYETRYWLYADLSERRIELRYGDELLETITVTVGRAESPTPPGDYAVTDALAGRTVGDYYGCCILALSGHQPSLPPGWLGGDRIAIHGTPGNIGDASSAGCLRAGDRDLIGLFARIPLGAPVFIRA